MNEADLNDIYMSYKFIRTAVTEKLFEIYLNSKNRAFQHKHENYMIFKVQIQDIIKDRLEFVSILMHTFERLKARATDFLPKMDSIKKKVAQSNNLVVEIPDAVEYNPLGVYDAEIRNNINQWVEDQIAHIQVRKRVSGDDPVEKNFLGLFRYLSVRSRVINPYTIRGSYRVDEDLSAYLEMCVCDCFSRLLDSPREIEANTLSTKGEE